MFGGSGLPSGVHGDIMSASPESDADKQRLVDEIRSRAKSILGSTRNYKEAMELYSKGIQVLPKDATLYGNRSMCHLSMKNKQLALDDADKAIECDPTYAKGYYRKAMAELEFNNLPAAYDALQENLKLAPNDKAVQAQIAKVTSLRDKAAASGAPTAVPKARNTVSTSSSTPPKPPVETKPKPTPSSGSSSAPKPKATETVVENTTDSTGAMKGYKLTSDGKKTSYFNNELDEKTKELIGDIRPKKLDAPAAVAASPAPANTSSAWNSAGTFEEKVITPWAKESLKGHLESVDLHIPRVFPHPAAAPTSAHTTNDVPLALLDIFIRISKVKTVGGDASTVYNRGKKKYLYDMNADCEWKFEAYVHTDIVDGKPGTASPVLTATGNCSVQDITPDDDCEFSVEMGTLKNNSKTISKNEFTGILTKYIRASGSYSAKSPVVDKLSVAIKRNINQFDTEMKSKY